MSSLKSKRGWRGRQTHTVTHSVQQSVAQAITARERHHLLVCFLQALVDSLALMDGARTSNRKSSRVSFQTPWGSVSLNRCPYKAGYWTSNRTIQFEECIASLGSELCQRLDDSLVSGKATSFNSVQKFVRAFLRNDATRERCDYVYKAIQSHLETHGYLVNRRASALRDRAAVLQYVRKNGLPANAIRITDDCVSVYLGVVFSIANVPIASVRRYKLKSAFQIEIDELAAKSMWSSKSHLYLPSLNRPHGRQTNSGLIINFRKLGIQRNGLFEDILRNFSRPADHRTVQPFLRWIAWLVNSGTKQTGRPDAISTSAKRILSTQPKLLSEKHLYALVEGFRARLAGKSLDSRCADEYTSSFRSLIKTGIETSGKKLSTYRLRNTSRKRRSSRGLVSSQPDPFASKSSLRPAIENVAIGSPQEARVIAKEHLADRIARINSACDHDVAQFLSWRKFLTAADELTSRRTNVRPPHELVGWSATASLPSFVRWTEQISPQEYASELLGAVKDRHLYEEKEFQRMRDQDQHVLAGPFMDALTKSYPELPIWFAGMSYAWAPLSLWYVPRWVQLAVQLRIQLATGWNANTVRNLCESGIVMTPESIELQSIKDKSGRKQDGVIERPDKIVRAGFEMLMQHSRSVSEHWPRESDAIFVTWINRGDSSVFGHGVDHSILKRFIRHHGLPEFTREQLRNQHMSNDYLLDEDPNRIQGKLGHNSLKDTSIYLGQTIFTVLNRANIAQFMRQLGATIVWAVEGESSVAKRGMSTDHINRRLLFPVAEIASESPWLPECDAWISESTKPLVIDRTRIAHLVRQRAYYAKSWQRLRAESSIRYERIHRPRIEFTAALWAIVSDSPHAHLLELQT